jgi:hypothetical protein
VEHGVLVIWRDVGDAGLCDGLLEKLEGTKG